MLFRSIFCDTGPIPLNFDGAAITSSPSQILLSGGGTSISNTTVSSYVFTSSDGISWTSKQNPFSAGSPLWVGGSINKFFIVSNTRVLSSTDAVNWNMQVLGLINGGIVQGVWSDYLQKICILASSAGGGKYGVAVSSDGLNWTYGDINSSLGQNFSSIEWSQSLKIFIAIS